MEEINLVTPALFFYVNFNTMYPIHIHYHPETEIYQKTLYDIIEVWDSEFISP